MTPLNTPTLKTIKQSKLNCKKNKHRGGSSNYRTPQLNNRAENQAVKKTKISAVSSMYDTNDEIVNYEMLLLSYIWQEIGPMVVFSESQPWGGNAVLTVEKR